MATAVIQTSFASGEVSPSLFGHVDLTRIHVAATTMRNCFVSFRGGSYSRAGTAFVGYSKQTGRSYPPRLIPFQFNVNQGLALEFGNFYMRVISDGAFVTDSGLQITGITNASPAVLSLDTSGPSVTSNNDAVTSSYAPGDTVTLAGGVFSVPAVLNINDTLLQQLAVNAIGNGYAPADTINLNGGTAISTAVVTVATTQVASVALISGIGTPNTAGVVTGTTGNGTKFTAICTANSSGFVTSATLQTGGVYTQNPANIANEQATGPGAFVVHLSLTMGVQGIVVSTPGVFSANPAGGNFTQASSSGSGTGATFSHALMAPSDVSFASPGTYTTFPSNPVGQASTSGTGVGVTFNISQPPIAPYATGDWVQLSGIGGMTEINGLTAVLTEITSSTFSLADVFGNPINTTSYPAYGGGGVANRIFTLPTIYAEEDLPWLKFTQSADVMSICCVNQQTLTEYPGQDLNRSSDANWTFTPIVPAASIAAPANATATYAGSSGGFYYSYQVTALAPDGTESVGSNIATCDGIDLSTNHNMVTITWDPVPNATQYTVYKAADVINNPPPVGALYGFAGNAYGTSFTDGPSEIVPDFSQVPPLHRNPFARGQVIAVTPTSGGSGATQAGTTATITSADGTGVVLIPIIDPPTGGGALTGFIIADPGGGYEQGDPVVITSDGTGLAATATIGPQSGTYPGAVSYYQQRRVYANSLNNPDTYWMSQPGSYLNFDIRIPTIASDAITGSPWAQQVNGIQWMIQTSGGLLVMTGLSAWLLAGVGSFATNVQPISPSTQDAVPQAFSGVSALVPPVRINYDVLYVESKGSLYYDLPYQLYTLSEPIDLTEISSHLFIGYTIRENAWCEQPYKILWVVRNDGILLSLTYYKTQQVAGWARHDTNGLFQSVCSVIELPVDALYCATQRQNMQYNTPSYLIERMDNRIWSVAEDCWCVDAGLSLAQPEPNATLNASSAVGIGQLTGAINIVGGSNYSAATTATVVDNNGQGPGTGAVPTITINNGQLTSVTFGAGQEGTGYINPQLVLNDPANTGSGGSAKLILDNSATFTASAPIFSPASVGSVIRMGGGIASITSYIDAEHVIANILSPITAVQPNSNGIVVPQVAGTWTLTQPISTVEGLFHLIGSTVTGLADGNVIAPQVVAADGSIQLPTAASAITVGLGFQAQVQSPYADVGEPTVQGQRKKIAAVTARLQASRGVLVGANQPDGSTFSPPQIAPTWSDLQEVPDKSSYDTIASMTPYNALCPVLYSADRRIPLPSGFQKQGQVCLQQNNPLPLQLLAWVPEILEGDNSEQAAQKRGRGQ